MMQRPGIVRVVFLSLAVALGLVVVPPVQRAEAFDVYTTPGYHTINGREWHTTCEKYSTTVERCRTEIKAHTIVYANGRFAERYAWVFNNLTYKPSPRAQWAGNILAKPGEHLSAGRRWKTECDTEWTGRGGCRSLIWTNSYVRTSSGYGTRWQWVFNNIVRFSDSAVTAEFCVPAESSVLGVSDADAVTASPAEAQPVEPAVEATRAESEPAVEVEAEPATEVDVEPALEVEAVPAEESEAQPVVEPAEAQAPVEDNATAAVEDVATPDEASPAEDAEAAPSELEQATVEVAATPEAAAVVIKTVQHPGHPAGALYDRLGAVEVKGTVSGAAEGSKVTVQVIDSAGKVRSTATATLSNGAFAALVAGGFDGAARIAATAADGALAAWDVTFRKAGVTLTGPTRIDPLGNATISGVVTPGIADVAVEAQVSTYGGWAKAGSSRTAADGTYSLTYSYDKGYLGTQQVRICATLPWGSTIPSAASMNIERARIANPVITNTTADEVRLTYRSGCPVGPSGLSTIRINQQSMDGHVYRGEIVVRRARAAEVADVFKRTFEAGFPVHQMTNPNEFGADDIKMMAANNTSGFNCRQVVGNPYALSPHSYGYAVDLNPWQNPYRDPNGKWHPSTDHVQRTPVVPGMLTTTSAPVKAFQSHGWSWFSGWDWHHFEKR